MNHKLAPRHALVGALLALGCGEPGDETGELSSYTQALNACDETVPATRQIDGIPAYAQCAMYQSGPIYSNNGVDTSATKVGADWVQTQPSGGYQCTELAHRYWLFRWQVRWLPRGNAGTWCDTMPPASSGVVQSTTPMHGDLMVLAPGSCGADSSTGHVNVVDVVDSAKQKLTVVEQNQARRGTYNVSCAKCFLHIVANQSGMPPDGGAPIPAVDAGTGTDAGSSRPVGPGTDAGAPPISPRDAGGVVSMPDASSVPDAGSTTTIDAAVVTQPPAADATVTPVPPGEAGAQPDDSADEESGCSVRSAGARGAGAVWALVALGALLARRRRARS